MSLDETAPAPAPEIITFRPWQRLPTELKLKILDVPLRLTRAVRVLTHPIHVNRALQNLTLTSKEMRSLALKIYYGNAVMLERAFQQPRAGLGTMRSQLRCVLACPKPAIGALIHRLELHLRVDDKFEYDGSKVCSEREDRRSRMNQWFLLLRPTTGPLKARIWSQWQTSFPNLNSMDLTIIIRGDHWDRKTDLGEPARCLELHQTNSITTRKGTQWEKTVASPRSKLEDMLEISAIGLHPRFVSVTVQGFACAGFIGTGRTHGVQCPHGCSDKVASVIKSGFGTRSDIGS